MRFSRVFIEAFGYELPPNVVTSRALEARLAPLYADLRVQPGQLEVLTGIRERRWWDRNPSMSRGAAVAGRKALDAAGVPAEAVGMLVYGGVCRDQLEPATGCAVAHRLGLSPPTHIYDVSNACLGVLNGIVHVANAIEMGHVRAGLVVSCESAREIVDSTIARLLEDRSMENLRLSLATLTGGSGAVAVLVVHESLAQRGHRLLGGVTRCAPQHHELCRWGPDTGIPSSTPQVMRTEALGVLKHGVALGLDTWHDFRRELDWQALDTHGRNGLACQGQDGAPDKIICHQVGATHRATVLESIGFPPQRDFATFEYLGNIGTVSLPISAAIADERGFLERGQRVGFLGIGSGLNCLMLGVEW